MHLSNAGATDTRTYTVHRTMGLREWIMLIVLSILWSGSFFFIGVAVRDLPPFTIVAIRVTIAAVVLLIVLRVTNVRIPRSRQLWLSFLIMGLLNNAIPFSLIVWGQTHIASGLAAILNATTPFFTVIIANFLTDDEKMTGARLLGILIGFGGVVVIIGPAFLSELGANILAQVAVLGASLSYAFAGVFGRRFQRMGVSPLVTADGQLIASSALLIPVALLVDRPWTLPMPGPEVWAAVTSLALLSTALAYILYFRLLATAGATNALLVTLLVPVGAVVLGATVLGEELAARAFVGMGFLVLGLAVIDGRPFAALRRRMHVKRVEKSLPGGVD
jgi:drug/metabolite transporter (DMT)-like permease